MERGWVYTCVHPPSFSLGNAGGRCAPPAACPFPSGCLPVPHRGRGRPRRSPAWNRRHTSLVSRRCPAAPADCAAGRPLRESPSLPRQAARGEALLSPAGRFFSGHHTIPAAATVGTPRSLPALPAKGSRIPGGRLYPRASLVRRDAIPVFSPAQGPGPPVGGRYLE